ncbi:MAG TPA: hypothetical protein VGN14_00885 [Candidatus Elarobacter sp.]|jgi:hypothetical protein
MTRDDSPTPFSSDAVAGSIPGAIDFLRSAAEIATLSPSANFPRCAVGTRLAVGGWAVERDATDPPAAVRIVVDDDFVYEAQIGFGRYDVRAALTETTPEHIGFRCEVPTEGLAPGLHLLHVYALGHDGAWYEAPGRTFSVHRAMRPEFSIRPETVQLVVDLVRDTDPRGERGPVRGIVPTDHYATVIGWAFRPAGGRAPAGVCVVDDAGGRWNGTCDVVREDARAALGVTDPRVGFEIDIPAASLGRGRHTLTVWAYDGGGQRIGRPSETKVEVVAEVGAFPGYARELAEPALCAAQMTGPKGEQHPLRAGDIVRISSDRVVPIEGWALLGDGSAPRQVILELRAPGSALPIRYYPLSGYHRGVPPKRLPAPPRDGAWFTYALDPSNLEPRDYALEAVVLSEDDYGYARGGLGTLRVVADGDASGTGRRT